MHYLLPIVLFLFLPNFAFGGEDTKPAPSYASGAPVDSNGVFTNYKGDIAHGSASVRLSFMLRRFGTYFRSGNDAPKRVEKDEAQMQTPFQKLQPAVT